MAELENGSELDILTQETLVPEEIPLSPEEQDLFNQMMEAGVFYGRSKSRTNPLMREFISATRSGFEVINVLKTITGLKEAAGAIEATVKNSGLVVLVGTSPAVKQLVKEMAIRLELPYVTERWLGGTITNFKVLSERINQFKKLKDDKATGRLAKYTKKEQLKLEKELEKSEVFFGGLERLDRFPSMMIIVDLVANTIAATEARQKNIPVVAVLNTDANPSLADYRIPANDRNSGSVKLILDYLSEVISRAKKERAEAPKPSPENVASS